MLLSVLSSKAFLDSEKRLEHLNCVIMSRTRRDETFLCFSLLVSNVVVIVFFFGKRDKHYCSASPIINLSMISIVDSLLLTLHASANRILRCDANAYFIGSGYAGSLSFIFSGCRPRFSRLAASPLNTRARVHSPY